MGQSGLGSLYLPVTGSPLELQYVLVDHAYTGRSRRMPEGLEPPIRIHRKVSAEFKVARADEVRGRSLLAETEIFVAEEFGEGEAIVYLGDVDLFGRIGDASHLVDFLGRPAGGFP